MPALALRRRPIASRRPDAAPRAAATCAGVLALMAGSVALRARGLETRLWMDEGIAVGIASHPLGQIPGVLARDGSPPLYYLLLHVWMGVAGRSEVATHALSLALAVLCVPAAWWAGTTAVDRRTGWFLAVLAAASPFLTTYARDTRMYTLVVLLGLPCVACFVAAYLHRRRAYALAFGLLLALLLYTHGWALFLGVAFGLAFTIAWRAAPRSERARVLRDGLAGFGVAALAYAPWLPTALFQARHTGAPWATRPGPEALAAAPAAVLGGWPTALLVVVACAAGLGRVFADAPRPRRGLAAVLATVATVPVLVGWALSQASPAWAARYLAIVVAPALLLAATGLARARRAGLAALGAVVLLWASAGVPRATSDAFQIAREARPLVRAGDLVISTQPEQVPLLAYYLPSGLRYASPFGRVRDPGVADWRDAVHRLARASVSAQLPALLRGAPAGGHVLLVVPIVWDPGTWRTRWARLERRRAAEYVAALRRDRAFAALAALPRRLHGPHRDNQLRALVFRKVARIQRRPPRGAPRRAVLGPPESCGARVRPPSAGDSLSRWPSSSSSRPAPTGWAPCGSP